MIEFGKVKELQQCNSIGPSGNQCSMAQGHAGPHKIGDVYHPSERWHTPCPDGKCEMMGNRDQWGNRWLECWKCGRKEDL